MLKFVKHSNLSDIEYGLKGIQQKKKKGIFNNKIGQQE